MKTAALLVLAGALAAPLTAVPATAQTAGSGRPLANPNLANPNLARMRPALRCTKQRDRALVHNVGQTTLPVGTRLEIHATGPTPAAEGTGVMNLTEPLAPGGTYTSEIRFSMEFTTCHVQVIPNGGTP